MPEASGTDASIASTTLNPAIMVNQEACSAGHCGRNNTENNSDVPAGFALAAKLTHPEAEVWIIYGDGSSGYSLAEFDTFARHNAPVIALVGNDASWAQIARDQVDLLKDNVATRLVHNDYQTVAAGFGGGGMKLDDPELVVEAVEEAQETAASGSPFLINAIIGDTDFRKGSISV